MVAVLCYLSTRIFRICPSQNWKMTRESVWVKVFANKTSHFEASCYRPKGGVLDKLESQLTSFEIQLEKIKDIHKDNNPPQPIFWGKKVIEKQ